MALPGRRSELLLRLVVSTIQKQDAASDRWQRVKHCPWSAVNKLVKASWQKATTFDCKKANVFSKVWMSMDVGCVTKAHHGCISPFGTDLGRADPLSPGHPALQSLAKTITSSFMCPHLLPQQRRGWSKKQIWGKSVSTQIFGLQLSYTKSNFRQPVWKSFIGKLMKWWHILEFLNDKV